MGNSTVSPNIFNFATSELSQDAFIAWLAEWADASYSESRLHKVATDFLQSLTGKKLIGIETVEAITQEKHIDILIKVTCKNDEKHIIVIENKVNTFAHSDQLQRYKEYVERTYAPKGWETHYVYFKTWNQGDYSHETEQGYLTFDRKKFLDVLNKGADIENAIFKDYHAYLQSLHNDFESWKPKVFKEWTSKGYLGFYDELKSELGEACVNGYHYVSNAQGGFQCFWSDIKHLEKEYNKGMLYLQLEGRNELPTASLRMSSEKNDGSLKLFYEENISEITNKLDAIGITHARPSSVRPSKRTMKVLELPNLIICNEGNGSVDLEKTLERIEILINMYN